MRARMHSYGLAVVAGMLPGRHVGVAGLGDRVLVSSTLHAGSLHFPPAVADLKDIDL
mgnify:CR=1 FL=1